MAFYPTFGLLSYFGQSNFAGQFIIIVLAAFSLLAWTVMLGKWMDLKKLRTANARFEREISEVQVLLNVTVRDGTYHQGPYTELVAEAVEAFSRYRPTKTVASKDLHAIQLRVGHVENALQRGVAEQTIRYENKMIMLGSIVTGAPFLGLLGTVWGVMDAFGSISQSSATLQALAPGVSGALLTTVAGLLVAIPSVFGYNYLLTMSKIAITELENFASTVADRIELEAQQLDY